jgi:hypothetical protein
MLLCNFSSLLRKVSYLSNFHSLILCLFLDGYNIVLKKINQFTYQG